MSKRGALALLCWVVAPATPFFFRPALTTLPRPPVRRHPRGLLAVESEPHSENAPAVDAAPETSLAAQPVCSARRQSRRGRGGEGTGGETVPCLPR